jgi:hypothetical protein
MINLNEEDKIIENFWSEAKKKMIKKEKEEKRVRQSRLLLRSRLNFQNDLINSKINKIIRPKKPCSPFLNYLWKVIKVEKSKMPFLKHSNLRKIIYLQWKNLSLFLKIPFIEKFNFESYVYKKKKLEFDKIVFNTIKKYSV